MGLLNIPHDQLLAIRHLYGIDPNWLISSNLPVQSVSISSSSGPKVTSKPFPNTKEVFQGSAIGPLLFITIFCR